MLVSDVIIAIIATVVAAAVLIAKEKQIEKWSESKKGKRIRW